MDPAKSDQLRAALRVREQRIHHHEEQLTGVCQEVAEASATSMRRFVSSVTKPPLLSEIPPKADVQESSTVSPGIQCLRLASPEYFSGDCHPFLSHCELHFEFQASAFPSDRAKIAYIISHLSGPASVWATDWNRRSAICSSLLLFLEILMRFSKPLHWVVKQLKL